MLRIGIDIGGTFTDFAAWRDDGDGTKPVLSLKVPSTPADFAEGFRTGFEAVLAALPPRDGEPVYVLHGTTVSTNTVIERSGACVALLTSRMTTRVPTPTVCRRRTRLTGSTALSTVTTGT